MLAALPSGAHPGGPAWLPVLVLAMPYVAGVFAGVVTVRIAPTPVIEAAPLWGFAAGSAAGVLAGLAAAFSGGSLGDGRLAAVGPSGFQVGLVAILEIGVTAALAAAAANWLILRRSARRTSQSSCTPSAPDSGPGLDPGLGSGPWPSWPGLAKTGVLTGVVDESDDADGHRIYFNPWATAEDDHEDEDEVDWSAQDPASPASPDDC
jgi:hypothetical protein